MTKPKLHRETHRILLEVRRMAERMEAAERENAALRAAIQEIHEKQEDDWTRDGAIARAYHLVNSRSPHAAEA